MFTTTARWLYQVGAHVPHGTAFRGATMKNWPRSALPKNFNFLPEQRLRMQPIPRDTGRVTRNFVLRMLYLNQPVKVDDLWQLCANDSGCVLDSKRHLREVLKSCRDESFVYFDRDESGAWQCHLARERYEEVKGIAVSTNDPSPAALGMRGQAAQSTAASMAEANASFGKASDGSAAAIDHATSTATNDAPGDAASAEAEQMAYITKLRQALAQSSDIASRFRRVEVDYLPYTDLNGKVKFMWWYDTKEGADLAEQSSASIPASSSEAPQLDAPQTAIPPRT